uniref:Uncharacterized protein n=1 Tax=Zooxanthella nutricula TaxID=1333877 RepID=A0A7S2P446_9DINO
MRIPGAAHAVVGRQWWPPSPPARGAPPRDAAPDRAYVEAIDGALAAHFAAAPLHEPAALQDLRKDGEAVRLPGDGFGGGGPAGLPLLPRYTNLPKLPEVSRTSENVMKARRCALGMPDILLLAWNASEKVLPACRSPLAFGRRRCGSDADLGMRVEALW